MIIGIDTGGTFTDFVLFDGKSLHIHKVLSTPEAPDKAIIQGMKDLGLETTSLWLVHGSTVATNAVLERKGVRTVFVTNKGFRDLLIIGRQARRELYNLTPDYVPPIVDPDLCLEVDTRLAADGTLLKDIDEKTLQQLVAEIKELKPESVAVSLLFAFLDNRQEQAIRDALPDDLFVSLSSEILPEYREYERGITTWLNSYVGPLVQGYLRRMEKTLQNAGISIMQSSGNICDADQAGKKAVNLLLSGPAGGLEGARTICEMAGHKRLMSLDMGGTSTDVALINDSIVLTSEGKVGDFPVSVPMVDIHTIGAGGGSIAWLDEGGLLQVGPQSAGADPGPVCYGQGGNQVTVTDANLILGRLPLSAQLGGKLALNKEAAMAAIKELASELGLTSAEEAATGIIRIANEHMAGALRVISVQKGYDPKDFVLVCFGGAGGLHVCELAKSLNMQKAIVPIHAGVLSALGMLTAKPGRQLSRTLAVPLVAQTISGLEQEFNYLSKQGVDALLAEGLSEESLQIEKSLDLCYQGQSFTLNVKWKKDIELAINEFHEYHKQRYGHCLEIPVELINVRSHVYSQSPVFELPQQTTGAPAQPREYTRIYGTEGPVPIWWRGDLVFAQQISGPAIIVETVSTTFVDSGWKCQVDRTGNLLLDKTEA
jgi:N-methylhydantoinase A